MDQQTFKKVKKREESAFLSMMQEHKGTVYYTALTYFKNEDLAREAVQEVTFRAYKNVHKVRKISAIKAWLTRITINYCLNEIKKNKRFSQDEQVLEGLSESFDPSGSLVLSQAVQSLSKKYQTIVIMKYQQDLTVTEISESLGMPVGTVKTYLNRALKELRAYMKRGGVNAHDYKA
ncbi:RNA polymerase sigma factor [Halobacillus litoralis]|uniref:RNA polymerase sigma factor n=1 Tax=Halobacillus litoralis TaxID=45668 RepID=UPI001CD4902E|nr:RNA polymerase sigma factor [Halobacillus litoralis]MCA0970708.1 RNA polymerase sigma factor [Halobacillus litoralis]